MIIIHGCDHLHIIQAVRSTQSIECPVSNAGKLIVDHQVMFYLFIIHNQVHDIFKHISVFFFKYIEFVCQLANEKFAENFDRIKR